MAKQANTPRELITLTVPEVIVVPYGIPNHRTFAKVTTYRPELTEKDGRSPVARKERLVNMEIEVDVAPLAMLGEDEKATPVETLLLKAMGARLSYMYNGGDSEAGWLALKPDGVLKVKLSDIITPKTKGGGGNMSLESLHAALKAKVLAGTITKAAAVKRYNEAREKARAALDAADALVASDAL